MKNHFSAPVITVLFALLAVAAPAAEDVAALKKKVVAHHAALVLATYQDALDGAKKLQKSVDAFLAKPSAETLKAARQAWLAARPAYLQTEGCRFYEGPIDQVEGYVNAWPVDEQYIDYVAENPKAGIVNAAAKHPKVTRELLLSLNERQGEKNISTGYHAVEFLLWGQDLSATGPGDRPHLDYVPGPSAAAANVERRRDYLRVVTRLLVEHLQTVTLAWDGKLADNFRAKLLAMPADEALGLILKGVGTMSGPELSGERLTVAYETKEQEDEHSCFSDNTHNDFIYDTLGLQNFYLGRYVRANGRKIEGPGLRDLIAAHDAAFAEKLTAQFEAGVRAAREIPLPFDQAILGADTAPGRVAIKKAIKALQAQGESIAKAAAVMKIPLNL
ncbi:MAG: iron-regulated protein [Verrucomicrobia bacterium]|nr:iron-regulated protein [Verrucomicrobiota bacterium]